MSQPGTRGIVGVLLFCIACLLLFFIACCIGAHGEEDYTGDEIWDGVEIPGGEDPLDLYGEDLLYGDYGQDQFGLEESVSSYRWSFWAPYVTWTTPNAATINWRQGPAGTGYVEYASLAYYIANSRYSSTVTDSEVHNYHHVQLTGLLPGTEYIYHVVPGGATTTFTSQTFRTMPVSGPYSFLVYGDTREGDESKWALDHGYVAEAMSKETDAYFVIHVGDMARYTDYKDNLDMDRWWTFFDRASPLLAKTAIFPAIGNHEYRKKDRGYLKEAYYYDRAFPDSHTYYFDCANIRYIVLSTSDPIHGIYGKNHDPGPSTQLVTAQDNFLRQQLNGNQAGTFVTYHYPSWRDGKTSVYYTALTPWEQLFNDYAVSAVFTGHVHNYQRYLVNGRQYFVIGNGGAGGGNTTFINPIPSTNQTLRKGLGYVKVTVDPEWQTGTAEVKYVADGPGGKQGYTFETVPFTLQSGRPMVPLNSGSGDSSSESPVSSLARSWGIEGEQMSFEFHGIPSSTLTSDTAVHHVHLSPATPLTDVVVVVTKSPDIGPEKTLTDRTFSQYYSIDLVNAPPGSISAATVEFSLDTDYLQSMNVAPEDVVIMRWGDGRWEELHTMAGRIEGGRVYFNATMQGFSYFVITNRPAMQITLTATPLPITTITDAKTTMADLVTASPVQSEESPGTTGSKPTITRTPAAPVEPEPIPPRPGITTIAIIGIAGIVLVVVSAFCIRRWWTRRQNPSLFRKYE